MKFKQKLHILNIEPTDYSEGVSEIIQSFAELNEISLDVISGEHANGESCPLWKY